MPKIIEVEVTVPEGLQEGDVFKVQVEVPGPAPRAGRGSLAGIEVADMTDEQLKREIINANSVLYKAKQRGAAEETIAANQARVDKAREEQAKRQGKAAEVKAVNVEEALYTEDEEDDTTVDLDLASEV